MNQIIATNQHNNYYYETNNFHTNITNNKKNNKYFLVFFISIIFTILIIFYLLFSYFLKIKKHKESIYLKDKYIVTTLYNTNSTNTTAFRLSENISIIGLIDIPKLNISYPILSNSNEQLLKISVCRFSGPLPNRIGNLCIAGHNYNNTLMFSKLDVLTVGDTIFITDLNNSKLEYIVYQKYKVKENDLNCTKSSNNVEITLITCNNNNNTQRIVIKAKMKG